MARDNQKVNLRKNQIGILIPTKGRYTFLTKFLASYRKYADFLNIYIGDSNSNNSAKKFESFIRTENFKNIFYYNMALETVGNTLFELAKIARKKVDYLTFHGDDDYIFPFTLLKFSEILERNSVYQSIQGRSITVEFKNVKSTQFELGRFGNYWGKPERPELNPLVRVIEHSNNYYVSNFSLQRTSSYLENSKTFTESINPVSNYWQEYLESYNIIFSGVSKYVDAPYLIRGVHDDRAKIIKGSNPSDPDYNSGKNYFKKVLVKRLSLTSPNLDMFKTEAIIEKLVQKIELNSYKKLSKTVQNDIKIRLPRSVKTIYKFRDGLTFKKFRYEVKI